MRTPQINILTGDGWEELQLDLGETQDGGILTGQGSITSDDLLLLD